MVLLSPVFISWAKNLRVWGVLVPPHLCTCSSQLPAPPTWMGLLHSIPSQGSPASHSTHTLPRTSLVEDTQFRSLSLQSHQ